MAKEPSFKVNKLDLLIALIATHVGLDAANPVLIHDNPMKIGFAILGIALITLLLGFVNARRG